VLESGGVFFVVEKSLASPSSMLLYLQINESLVAMRTSLPSTPQHEH